MQLTNVLKKLGFLLVAGILSSPAWASIDDDETDPFVAFDRTDMPLSRYEAGDLGVVLPSYPRVYLYPAWRAVVLGRDGLRKYPASAGGLARALGNETLGWVNINDASKPANQWTQASQKWAPTEAAQQGHSFITMMTAELSGYINCPQAAFSFANDMLKELSGRADASPQRLKDWVTAQRAVFAFCEYGAQKFSNYSSPQVSGQIAPKIPDALPPSEPLYWRQLRDYQIAAASFYDGQFPESIARFEQIGATAGHPMHTWGAYLALRSRIRAATLAKRDYYGPVIDEKNEAAMAEVRARVTHILADPTLVPVHDLVRASLRTAQYRLAPNHRFEELTAALNDVQTDPYLDDHLVDWRRLSNDLIQFAYLKEPASQASLRNRFAYFDWILTLQCGQALDPKQLCAVERAHATQQWQRALAADGPLATGYARAWQLAVLMLADQLTPSIESAALKVPSTAPEYFTIRYNLARLYGLSGKADRARAIDDEAIPELVRLAPESVSASNLFSEQRFSVAESLEDAAHHLVRKPLAMVTHDSSERDVNVQLSTAAGAGVQLDASTLQWLNGRLSVADLLKLAGAVPLDSELRGRIAIAAWIRADLLHLRTQAEEAARLTARSLPFLTAIAQRYLASTRADERTHWLLLNSMLSGFRPSVGPDDNIRAWIDLKDRNGNDLYNVFADMWCDITIDQHTYRNSTSYSRNELRSSIQYFADVSTYGAARDAELEALSEVKTSTSYTADHVLAWARSHPNDPDLPWLLHVIVQSMRSGCVSPGGTEVARATFVLLHKRFASSEWATGTPYWYDPQR